MAFDAVVVGGGLAGVSVAHALVGLGCSTLLVDRADPGRATDAGAGILSPETTHNPDDAWFNLAFECGAAYRDLVPTLHDPGYSRCGLLTISLPDWPDSYFEEAANLALSRQAHRGQPPSDELSEISSEQARDMFPPLGPVSRALLHQGAARVDGRKMCAALLGAAQAQGLKARVGSMERIVLDGGRATAVDIDGERVTTANVIIAGGAWSSAFADLLGVPVAVQPWRGQIIHLGVEGTATWPIVQPILSHYLVPWPDGRVAVGATVEPHAGFDARATVSGVLQLLGEAVKTAPGLADATFLEVRVGLRPVSDDGQPLLGPVPGAANVHLATGYGADGLLLSPGCGRLVAAVAVGQNPTIDITPWSVSRFM